jgi:hypothetical protein
MDHEKRDELEKRAVTDAEQLMRGLQENLTKSLDCLPLLSNQEAVVTQSFIGLFRGLYGLDGPPHNIAKATGDNTDQEQQGRPKPPPQDHSQN